MHKNAAGSHLLGMIGPAREGVGRRAALRFMYVIYFSGLGSPFHVWQHLDILVMGVVN